MRHQRECHRATWITTRPCAVCQSLAREKKRRGVVRLLAGRRLRG